MTAGRARARVRDEGEARVGRAGRGRDGKTREETRGMNTDGGME